MEGDHKRDISIEKALDLLKANCWSALEHVDTPLWRGTKKSSEDAYFIHGEAGETGRESANTTNHYTILMDTFLPYYGYPLRSKSIIFANNANYDYASSFGKSYAVFPYDSESIGVCQKYDLWQTEAFRIGQYPGAKTFSDWNYFWSNYGISSASWKEFERTLTEKMAEEDTIRGQDFRKWFGPPEKLRSVFEKAFSPENLHLELTNTENVYDIEGEHELWMSGKCIAIKKNVYHDILPDLRNLR